MRRLLPLLTLVAAVAALLPSPANAAEHRATDIVVESTGADGATVEIHATVFKPAAAARRDVPVILHSHGWGGSRTTEIGGEIEAFLDAGLAVVSFDQRGFGASGGQANVQDPDLEAEDVEALVDHIAGLDWVAQDKGDRNDPVLGAIGGSYGGGYQTMSALDEIAETGDTRFDALAPEITWYDLPESLAPQGVSRTAWVTALYAAGAQAVPQYIHESFVYGAATGQWPDGTVLGTPTEGVPDLDSEFARHSPRHFSDKGIKIDVPMLLRQGTSDNLFNLNQGLHIFDDVLTADARRDSLFVAFNGGHALPNALPPGEPLDAQLGGGNDACSGDWTKLRIEFFKRAFAGKPTATLLPARYNFTDLNGTDCHRLDSAGSLKIGVNEDLDPTGGNSMIATAGLGGPVHLPLQAGPVTVTGIPTLAGTYTSLGVDARVFFALSVGTTPADARVIQNNLMPLHVLLPETDGRFEIELPGVAAEVAEGQQLFLTITPVSDMFFGHGSRTPGALLLGDLQVKLPVVK